MTDTRSVIQVRGLTLVWGRRTYVMDVLNVTPDSFSGDGVMDVKAAIAHGRQLLSEGVDIVDVGGESTRPGAQPVPLEEELRRVIPVVAALVHEFDAVVSVDTMNTWAAFVGTNEKAAIAGDVAMVAGEVTPVLKALRKNGLDVVAIHHHMTQTQPTIFFLHYWGTGPADKLATGFKAALAELGRPNAATSRR